MIKKKQLLSGGLNDEESLLPYTIRGKARQKNNKKMYTIIGFCLYYESCIVWRITVEIHFGLTGISKTFITV